MEYYIGIDIGTSSAKLVLIDDQGTVLQQQNEEYQILKPRSGWKEIDPDIWFQAAKQGMVKLLPKADASLVKGIGITGQMHTTVFMDENGDSIRPAIMWNDIRTQNYIKGLKDKIDSCSDLTSIANIISTGSPASNLLWLKENEPENFQRMKQFLIGPDYLVYRFSGIFGTDYCEASTSSLYDLEKKEWSPFMQELIGIPWEAYPVVRESTYVVGNLKEELAKELNLNPDVKMIAGTGDNPAASISTGCLTNMYPVLSLGTSGVLMIPKKKLEFESKGKHILFSANNNGILTLVQGVVQSAGNSFSWWVKDILESTDFDKETRDVDLSTLGKGELVFYPHLAGDKTIYADSSIRGAFLGVGTDVTRKDMVVSIMEGICFAVKELTEQMKLTKENLSSIKVTGGGSKSKVWMQILADILDTKIEQLDGNVGAAFGIALLAGYGCGGFPSLTDMSAKSVKVKSCYTPRTYNARLYADKYEHYKKIYRAMKLIFE